MQRKYCNINGFCKQLLDFSYFALVSLKEKQMITCKGLLYVRHISVERIVSDEPSKSRFKGERIHTY